MTTLRLACWIVIALACAGLDVTAAHAAAPQARIQSPGFYRPMLGDFEITALDDGSFDLRRTRC